MPDQVQLAAACALMGHSLGLGVYMSSFRIRAILSGGGKEALKKMIDSKPFKVAHATQLNNTEWAPYMVVSLLFCHSQGGGSDAAAILAVVSSVMYTVAKIGLGAGATPISAGLRYLSIAWLIGDVYRVGSR